MKYSAMNNGFFDESIHGVMMLDVPDPAWVRPTVEVAQDDGSGGIIMVTVPDESVVHPTFQVPNPDTKIPGDAVDITPAAHTALLEAQAGGKIIQPGANGYPVAVNPPGASSAEIWARIKAKRDHLTRNGGFSAGGKWFHSDEFSRSQHLGLIAMGANIPANLQWKTMDGTFVAMTQALAGQILASAGASDQAIFEAAETHRAAMEAAEDHAAYDFSAGWPVTFLG